jgi:hypothetical protein
MGSALVRYRARRREQTNRCRPAHRLRNVRFAIDHYGPMISLKPVTNLLLARRLLLQVGEAFHFSPSPGHRIEHETSGYREKGQ